MKKIISIIITLLFSFSFLMNAALPSQKFLKDKESASSTVNSESVTTSNSTKIGTSAIKAYDEGDPDDGSTGGESSGGSGFVGGTAPISDALYPMFLAGFLYIGYTSRKKIATFFKKKR